MKSSLHALRLLGLAGLGTLTVATALAQDGGYSYGGIGIGQSRSKINEQDVATTLVGPGVTTTVLTRDRRDTAYKLFGGYQFNRNFALEAGYFDLGRFGFTADTANESTLAAQVRARGVNLDLVGTMPLSDRWSVLARVGAAYTRVRDDFSGSAVPSQVDPVSHRSSTNLKYGAGLQYAVSSSFLVRAEAERYRIDGPVSGHANVDTASVSLVFPFGRSDRAAPRAMAMPMMYTVAAAPAPAPVAEPTPAPVVAPVAPAPIVVVVPERRRVSFEAESLFGFDKSTLRAEGKAALDGFAKELEGTRFDMITVEGHTDRLGSTAYNQTLSQQRADAVKAYLVASGHVDAAKVSAAGKSESVPATKPEDCKGNKATAQLIACLQPDRRVEIEVVGTR